APVHPYQSILASFAVSAGGLQGLMDVPDGSGETIVGVRHSLPVYLRPVQRSMHSTPLTRRHSFYIALCAIWFAANASAAEPHVTEGFVNAPVAEVWRLFTTSAGYVQTGPAKAEVDLRLGGTIRSHEDPNGELGDPETFVQEILAYEPERMLALRVKQTPASSPHRGALEGVWTVLYFTASGENMTHIRIVGLGYGDTQSSQAARELVALGNRRTLDTIAKHYWPQCARCAAESQDSDEPSAP